MRSRIDPLLGMSVAGVLGLTIVQLLAQTATGVFEGRAAFGDWRADRPGVRRLIKPRDLPPPQPKDSVANRARIAQRTDEQPVVPSGFAVNLFASGLTTPRLIRAAPNGDIFVAESRAGRVSVLRPDGGVAAKKSVFASGLNYPFGIAFYPPGAEPQWVYVAETGAVVRFPYRSGDLASRGEPEMVVPRLPTGGHATRESRSRRTAQPCMCLSDRAPTMPKVWAGCPAQACKTSSPTIRSGRHGAMRPIAPMS